MADGLYEAVRGLWLEYPEIGVKALLAKLREQRPELGAATREVRKALKALKAESKPPETYIGEGGRAAVPFCGAGASPIPTPPAATMLPATPTPSTQLAPAARANAEEEARLEAEAAEALEAAEAAGAALRAAEAALRAAEAAEAETTQPPPPLMPPQPPQPTRPTAMTSSEATTPSVPTPTTPTNALPRRSWLERCCMQPWRSFMEAVEAAGAAVEREQEISATNKPAMESSSTTTPPGGALRSRRKPPRFVMDAIDEFAPYNGV